MAKPKNPVKPPPKQPRTKRTPGPKPGSKKMPEQREKIQASQLVNRLQGFVHGDIWMEPHQVSAALGLLKKTMPDLTSMKLQGDPTAPLTIITRAE